MPIYALGEFVPVIDPTAYIHPDAVIIGRVTIGAEASVWPTAVLRGDHGSISVGDRTSVQDGTIVHTSPTFATVIGANCVIGHNAHLEGATVGDRCVIGSMSICLNGSVVGADSLIAAGALVPPGLRVPAGSRVIGAPAKVAPHHDPAGFAEYVQYGVASYVADALAYPTTLRRIDR
jgi:carbonic anhydrase/acetyltransferase-like protein (isoleucine patch superfamily)